MKTAKLIIGIISIVLFLFIAFQSCAAGLGNALSENGEISGSAGFFVALMFLAGGITTVAGRNSKGASIASIILYVFGALIGFVNAGSYGDLYIWSAIALIIAVVHLASVFTQDFKSKA